MKLTIIAQQPPTCACCEQILTFVWITTADDQILCVGCFEKLHPRHAAINRSKKSDEQLELPL